MGPLVCLTAGRACAAVQMMQGMSLIVEYGVRRTYFSWLKEWVLLQEVRDAFWAQNSCWLLFTTGVLTVLNKYSGIPVCMYMCVCTHVWFTRVHSNPRKWGRRDQYGFSTFCRPGNWSVSYWVPSTTNEVCIMIPSIEMKRLRLREERAWPKTAQNIPSSWKPAHCLAHVAAMSEVLRVSALQPHSYIIFSLNHKFLRDRNHVPLAVYPPGLANSVCSNGCGYCNVLCPNP